MPKKLTKYFQCDIFDSNIKFMTIMKQKNKQTVFFQNNGQWYRSNVDLKNVYTSTHATRTYGSSADVLVNEMLANLLELACQKAIRLTRPMVITDYGCGQSRAANALASIISKKAVVIDEMINSGKSFSEIFAEATTEIKEQDNLHTAFPEQIMQYGHITVQRYDIGIPEFAVPLPKKADIVFCNDVFEHIPLQDLSAFIEDLEAAGKYIFASISLRDAVNYNKLSEDTVMANAIPVSEPGEGIILNKDISGAYIFSLHVTIMPQDKWQSLLGKKWTLLPAQDYTACSAMNFAPSSEYQRYKRELISKVGFADFIQFPTMLGTLYETDPILFRRTALIQAQKHLYKLNALETFPESPFKEKELAVSKAFLRFIGASVKKGETGLWEFAQELPEDYLSKLTALEHLSKKAAQTNQQVQTAAAAIISEYNAGKTAKIDNYR